MGINNLFISEIIKLDNTMALPGFKGDVREVRVVQDYLKRKIDQIGKKSAVAQGLAEAITSVEKFRFSNQLLYLIKDSDANNGDGELIGYLKIGQKNLYLNDDMNKVRQVEPLCVLDFYIMDEYQRKGYGKKLFDYMLSDLKMTVHQTALDNPSVKFQSFLKKHYKVKDIVVHANKFGVTSEFFHNQELSAPRLPQREYLHAGRYTAHHRESSIARVIHGSPNTSIQQPQVDSQSKIKPLPESEPTKVEPNVSPPKEIQQDFNTEDHEDAASVSSLPDESKNHKRPSTLEVRPMSEVEGEGDEVPAGSVASHPPASLTDRGYFDVKFYHNQLW